MRVLVTGNLGYLGPMVVQKLKDRRIYTIGLDTAWYLPTMSSTSMADYLPDEQLFVDLRSLGTFPLPQNVDVVVHLAGLSNDPMSEIDATQTKRINFYGTVRLINWYPDARHVVASSASVYGASKGGQLSSEFDDTNPLTEYAKAKLDVDQYMSAEKKNNWASLRFGTMWGWSPNIRRDLVVNAFCWQAAKSKEVAPAQNARRPLINVKDAAEMIAASVTSGYDGVINCSAENTTVLDIAHKVAVATESSLVPCAETNLDARDYWMDTTNLMEGLGYGHPFITLDNKEEIEKVFVEAKRRGESYPTRIAQLKEIIDNYGQL
jgi:nucleoside-diphosphate-sugar epimerase